MTEEEQLANDLHDYYGIERCPGGIGHNDFSDCPEKTFWLKDAYHFIDKKWRNYSDRAKLQQYFAANLVDGETEGHVTFDLGILLDDLVDLVCGYNEEL